MNLAGWFVEQASCRRFLKPLISEKTAGGTPALRKSRPPRGIIGLSFSNRDFNQQYELGHEGATDARHAGRNLLYIDAAQADAHGWQNRHVQHGVKCFAEFFRA